MHIPQNMLQGGVCPVTLAVSAVGLGCFVYAGHTAKETVSTMRWVSTTALLFVLQLLNFPVTAGTSGHLVGGILAVTLLGVPRAVLSMAMVIITQACLFGDGGIDALGANVLNMAMLGTGIGGLTYKYLLRRQIKKPFALVLASWFSVFVAAVACSFELGFSGSVSIGEMLKAMLPIHMLIGMGEAFFTLVLWRVLLPVGAAKREIVLLRRFAFCCLIGLVLLPVSSGLPDGLTSAVSHFNLTSENSKTMLEVFKDSCPRWETKE